MLHITVSTYQAKTIQTHWYDPLNRIDHFHPSPSLYNTTIINIIIIIHSVYWNTHTLALIKDAW